MSEIDQWLESQEFQITLDAEGKIIDFLEEDKSRPNTPEERIRQKMGQILYYEFNYPKESMAFERHINMGREKKRADIVSIPLLKRKPLKIRARFCLLLKPKRQQKRLMMDS